MHNRLILSEKRGRKEEEEEEEDGFVTSRITFLFLFHCVSLCDTRFPFLFSFYCLLNACTSTFKTNITKQNM